jgi:hypothetical protein
VSEAEVNKLPDPEMFRDALLLAAVGRWSPAELDATDALLLAVVEKIRTVTVKEE